MDHRPIALFALLASFAVTAVAQEVWKERPPAGKLRAPPNATLEQVRRGERIFHGELANGRCSICHGRDAKGTGNGNDLTLGMWIWSDGSLHALRRSILHNMKVAPGMDGDLTEQDAEDVAAYVWAIGHQKD